MSHTKTSDVFLFKRQADFLLEKYKEAFLYISTSFLSLLTAVRDKKRKEKEPEFLELLSSIELLLKEYSDALSSQIRSEIEELGEQVKHVEEILDIKNESARLSACEQFMEEVGEIERDDTLFKKEIIEDFDKEKQSLATMIADIKSALEEGKLQELREVLAHMNEDDEDIEDDQFDQGGEFFLNECADEGDKLKEEKADRSIRGATRCCGKGMTDKIECCSTSPNKKGTCHCKTKQ